MNNLEAIIIHSLLNMSGYNHGVPVLYRELEARCSLNSRSIYNDALCSLAKKAKITMGYDDKGRVMTVSLV